MKNKKTNAWKIAFKYFPLYIISIVFLFASQYFNSLVSLFIGQSLSIFADEEIILPSLFARFIDTTSKYSQLKSLTLLFIAVGLIMVILRFIRTIFRVLFSNLLESDVSAKFFSHSIRLPKKYLSSHPTGDIIQRNIQDSKKFMKFFGNGIFDVLYSVATISVVLFQIFYLSKVNFMIGFTIIMIIIVFIIIYSLLYVRKKEFEMSKIASKMDGITQQSFSNIMMVKSFANEEKEYKKLVKWNNKMQDTQYDLDMMYARYWAIMDFISIMYSAIMMVVIGYLFIQGNIGIGIATSLILYNRDIIDNTSELIGRINRLIRSSVAPGRLNEYFAAEDDFVVDGTLTPDIMGDIKVENVSMKYEGEEKYALSNITFHAKAGETIGIVGKSGSGKSTLINILTRLDEYDSGSIKYDGVELKDIKKVHLRDNVGIVNQDSFIFAKTIYDNLTILTHEDSTLDRYVEDVCLKDDIDKMPQGYETMVGEKGVTLSGGQRQRISIVRSLMKNKNVLFLDDSLSAIDNNVARKIKESLKSKKATTFIVSHNLMNVMDADKIMVLDKGEIVQFGTHDELIVVDGIYKDIWTLQQKIKDGDINE